MYAQCGSYFAPALIHFRSSSTCSGVSGGFFDAAGGIRISGSSLVTRAITSLVSASPGNDRPLVRALLGVEPQLGLARAGIGPVAGVAASDRIGRMSRLKLRRIVGRKATSQWPQDSQTHVPTSPPARWIIENCPMLGRVRLWRARFLRRMPATASQFWQRDACRKVGYEPTCYYRCPRISAARHTDAPSRVSRKTRCLSERFAVPRAQYAAFRRQL